MRTRPDAASAPPARGCAPQSRRTARAGRPQSSSARRHRAPRPVRHRARPRPARGCPAPTPAPGPSTTALSRWSARSAASSSAPSTGRTITARLAAALTASASRGLASVTSPAPARSAPRAASRAAPVNASATRHDHGVPARVFVAVETRHRKDLAPQRRTVREGLRPNGHQHARRNADVDDAHLAGMQPSGQQHVTGLAAKERDALGGLHRRAHHGAARAVDAARQVDRDDRRAARVHRLDQRARHAGHRRD